MIKSTSDGRFYVTADPSKTFASENEARGHEAYLRHTRNVTRPDSRPALQRMADADFKPPMADKPGQFDALKASLQSQDAGYKANWTREQRLLHSIKLTEARQQDQDDANAARTEWFAQPVVQAGLTEAKRLLAVAEDDPTIDNAEIVLASQVIESYSTPGADLMAVGSMLRRLRGFEADRVTTAQIAANDRLNAALAQVQALGAVTKSNIKVPVTGDSLVDRGHSYINNLMAGDAPYEQIDAAFAAMNAFHTGNAEPLNAALALNAEAA